MAKVNVTNIHFVLDIKLINSVEITDGHSTYCWAIVEGEISFDVQVYQSEVLTWHSSLIYGPFL